MKNYKTTTKDFKYFKERCLYWQKELGLMNWQLSFFHEKLEGKKAHVAFQYSAHTASLVLSTDWGDCDVPTKKELERTVYHEMIHLVLAPLTVHMFEFYSIDFVDQLEHPIVQKFVNLQYK